MSDLSNKQWGDRDSGGYASWGEGNRGESEEPLEIMPREITLKRIRKLEIELSAKIVVQEEIGHWTEGGPLKGSGGPCSFDKVYDNDPPSEYIVDQPRILGPDKGKREAAREELQKIYDSVEQFGIKYRAGRALGYSRFRILFGKSPI